MENNKYHILIVEDDKEIREQKNSAAGYLEKCAERRLLRGKILRNGSTASAAIRTGTLFPTDLSDAGNKEQ